MQHTHVCITRKMIRGAPLFASSSFKLGVYTSTYPIYILRTLVFRWAERERDRGRRREVESWKAPVLLERFDRCISSPPFTEAPKPPCSSSEALGLRDNRHCCSVSFLLCGTSVTQQHVNFNSSCRRRRCEQQQQQQHREGRGRDKHKTIVRRYVCVLVDWLGRWEES